MSLFAVGQATTSLFEHLHVCHVVLKRRELPAQTEHESTEHTVDARVERLAVAIEQSRLPQVLHHIPVRGHGKMRPESRAHNTAVDEG